MKTTLTVAIAGLWILIAFQACTKQELVTIDEPLKLDENSVQYQQYMEERATELIKKYRFDQLGNTIDRIKDSAAKERVLVLLTEYRDRAFNEALYYAKPNGDTIFFFPPNIDDRKEAKRLYISNLYQKAVINEIGVLHGVKNFPKVETVDIGNSLATGIKDLNGLPELKTFNWTFVPYYFGQFYPEVELAPVPLELDFSQNHKLEGVNIQYVDMAKLKFPATKIKGVNLEDAIINKSEEINGISAGIIGIRGVSEAKSLILTSKATDSLTMQVIGLQSLDMSETEIKKLMFLSSGLEKIKFNEGLRNLNLIATDLKELPTFPESITELTVQDYPFAANYPSQLKKLTYTYVNGHTAQTNLSHLNKLDELFVYYTTNNGYTTTERLEWNGSTLTLPEGLKRFEAGTSGYYLINVDGMKFPSSVRSVNFNGTIKNGTLDLSVQPNLKEVIIYAMQNGTVKLPVGIERINISARTPELDLSHLTNLQYLSLSLGSTNKVFFPELTNIPVKLILPPNLQESALSVVNIGRKPINLTPGSTIVNEPAWFDKYVEYINY